MEALNDFRESLILPDAYLASKLALLLIFITCFHRVASVVYPSKKPKRFPDLKYKECKGLNLKSRVPKPISWYHEMFFKLHNLEDHEYVLESARDELLAMMGEGISIALKDPEKSILRIKSYDPESLRLFMSQEHDKIMTDWAAYLDGRQLGNNPRLFGTIVEAQKWLIQRAPSKLIDGAWLSHIHKITTPFAVRGVTKDAWQILSEELGDGDVSKNHVFVYRELLEELGISLPDPQSLDFIGPYNLSRMDDNSSWKSAISQLLISLFPHEFLPEILGFNLHYELISLEAMMAARELKDLGANPSYFLLHVCIDNADSGHTAMALQNVISYLEMIKATEREAVFEEIWRRVQTGYTLSQTSAVSPCDGIDISAVHAEASKPANELLIVDTLTRRIIKVFKSKSFVSPKYHCQSKVRIGSRTLAEWLDFSLWAHDDQHVHLELLEALAQTKRWVRPGSGKDSKLVQELSWGGRMFGAFTNEELDILTAWIDALGPENSFWTYYRFTGKYHVPSRDAIRSLQDPACHHPCLTSEGTDGKPAATHMAELLGLHLSHSFASDKHSLKAPGKSQLSDVVALWFAHIGLLENMINVPCHTATSLHSSILLVLRAQAGFAVEADVPAGMAEVQRQTSHSLVDIGLELISNAQWTSASGPMHLKEVLSLTKANGQSEYTIAFAYSMLHWANRPNKNFAFLLGLAFAFLALKDSVTRSSNLLCDESIARLRVIIKREEKALSNCLEEMKNMNGLGAKELDEGYCCGSLVLTKCLGQEAGQRFENSGGSLII